MCLINNDFNDDEYLCIKFLNLLEINWFVFEVFKKRKLLFNYMIFFSLRGNLGKK